MQEDLARAFRIIEKDESYRLWITRLKWDYQDKKNPVKYERSKKILNSPKENKIAEYWIEFLPYCKTKFNDIYPGWGYELTDILRWKTLLGEKLQAAVRDFIEEKEKISKVSRFKPYYKIDLVDLSFKIDGENKYINELLQEIAPDNTTFPDWTDLRGIDLSEINLGFLEIANANFANADFSRAHLLNVYFTNCWLYKCTFIDSYLKWVEFDDISKFTDPHISGAIVHNISIKNINDKLGLYPIISEISYINLLNIAIARSVYAKYKRKYTDFYSIDIGVPRNGIEKKYLSYISWYQDTMLEYTSINARGVSIVRIKNILTALLTKNCRSLWVTSVAGVLFILLYSLLYYLIGSNGFNKGFDSFIAAVYYSLATFTNFGDDDISPNHNKWWILTIIMSEIILGYVWLGISLFVLTNKILESKS